MKYQRATRLFFVGALVFAASYISVFSQDFEAVEIQTKEVAKGIYMLIGGGGNIGVSVGTDGVLLIDSQFAQLVPKIKAAVRNLNSGPIRYVLNTNWHYDHVSGNVQLAAEGAIIIAHENTADAIVREQVFPILDSTSPAQPANARPTMTFSKAMSLHFNGEDIQILHLPRAHSDADMAIYFPHANVMHTGDLVFPDGYPFIDISHGGSVEGTISAMDRLLGIIDENTKVIPGHGMLSGREEVLYYRNMLATVRDRVKKQMEKGKSLDEILASNPVQGVEMGTAGMPVELFVKIVYLDLSQ